MRTLDAAEPLYFIGLGSNLLVRDGGVRGTVIVMHQALSDLKMDGDLIYAEAGVTCAKLARFSAAQSKTGGEFWAGIPGTVGGALAMNAGCYGRETWNSVQKVRMINRKGQVIERSESEFIPSYRHVEMPQAEEWYLGAWFQLADGNSEESNQKNQGLADDQISEPAA